MVCRRPLWPAPVRPIRQEALGASMSVTASAVSSPSQLAQAMELLSGSASTLASLVEAALPEATERQGSRLLN